MKRWYLYGLIGLAFGVIDWFYQDWLTSDFARSLGDPGSWMIPIMFIMNYGIWLVPLTPAVILESRKAHRIKTPILTGILIWSSAIFGYYAYYGILLSLGKIPYHEHLNIFGEKYVGYWQQYWWELRYLILRQFLEWIPIAIFGGAFIGGLAWWVFKPRQPKKADQSIG